MSNELRNLILNLYIFLKYQGMRVERSKWLCCRNDNKIRDRKYS
jgi:hypothetical protein